MEDNSERRTRVSHGPYVNTLVLKSGQPRLASFVGPAALVAVGYMDPGNWATDLEGGARFGYQLLWVLLAANMAAVLLQMLAARLGIVAERDLAQACRAFYPPPVAASLWALCEVAIVACDLAEVLGSAIALNLLFGIPLAWGALLTGLDVMLIVALQSYGIRRLEAVVAAMVTTVGVCVAIELLFAHPDIASVAQGLVPHRFKPEGLYLAVGILGATVMPHNLYLHSALVRTRRIGASVAARHEAIRYNLLDTGLALNIAFLVNAAILVLSAGVFFKHGLVVTELSQAHALLESLLGSSLAPIAFGVGLLAAGQSSTITGTLAGQVVMEGFLNLRMAPVVRRLITRGLAIVPAVIVLALYGESGATRLLVLSQVILSLQLPFAVLPLVRFTSDRRIMGVFMSPLWMKGCAWLVAGCITGLNMWLLSQTLSQGGGQWSAWAIGTALFAAALGGGLLLWIAVGPLESESPRKMAVRATSGVS